MRSRPRQHVRKLKSGKKVLINKGVKPKKKRAMVFKHHYGFNSAKDKNIKTVMMDPEEFLKATHNQFRLTGETHQSYEDYINKTLGRKSIDWHKKAIPSKEKTVEIPFLTFDKWGRPIGHEGRHTSKAAMELGMKKIPVTIEQRRYSWLDDVPPTELDYLIGFDKDQVKKLLKSEAYKEQPLDEEFIFSGDFGINDEEVAKEAKEYHENKRRAMDERLKELREERERMEKERDAREAAMTDEDRIALLKLKHELLGDDE